MTPTGLKQGWYIALVMLVLASPFAPAHAGKTLEQIRQRGQLVCGVSTGVIGFSSADSQGKFSLSLIHI